MRYTFADAQAPSRHDTQYYEMFGHRAIYHNGWKAVAYHERNTDFDKDRWELYHVDEDFSESHDLAMQEPARLAALVERWWSEAGKNNVLPLDDRGTIRSLDQPRTNRPPAMVTYQNGMSSVPRSSTPNFRDRSHSITAEVDIPDGGAEGVLLSMGGRFAGFSFYVQQNRLHYAYNFFGLDRYTVDASEPLSSGPATLRVDFTRSGENQGNATLFVNDKPVGTGPISRTVPLTFGLSEGLTIGRDPSTPVTEKYASPFAFNGTIKRVTFAVVEAAATAGGK